MPQINRYRNIRSHAPKPINGTYKSIIKQFKYKRGCLEVLCVKYSGFIWNSMVISYPSYHHCLKDLHKLLRMLYNHGLSAYNFSHG